MLMNLEAVREASEDAMSLLTDPDAGAETHILRALGTLDRLSAKVGTALPMSLKPLALPAQRYQPRLVPLISCHLKGM